MRRGDLIQIWSCGNRLWARVTLAHGDGRVQAELISIPPASFGVRCAEIRTYERSALVAGTYDLSPPERQVPRAVAID